MSALKLRRRLGRLGCWNLALLGCFMAVLSGSATSRVDVRTVRPDAPTSPPLLAAPELAFTAADAPANAAPAATQGSNQTASQDQSASTDEPVSAAARARISERYGRIPLHFEPNMGQTADEVRYLARGHGYMLFLTDEEAVLVLRKGRQPDARPDSEQGASASLPTHSPKRESRIRPETSPETAVVRMRLEGTAGNVSPKVEGLERLPGISNYYLGNDPEKWHSGVPHYARVRYEGVYPGIDLVFRGNPSQLEYDFVVAAGADPNLIRLSFAGADAMRIDEGGNLVLAVAGEELVPRAPRIYQEVNGKQRLVAGGYRLLSIAEAGDQATIGAPSTVPTSIATGRPSKRQRARVGSVMQRP